MEDETIVMLIDAVNAALVAGDWVQVVSLTDQLYAAVMVAGDPELTELAALVQDLHSIASDALMHPLEVMAVLFP